MQKHVNLVDLVKSFPMSIYLQKSASIQPRTSPIKFAHLAEKSEKGSVSNLSTKVERAAREEGFRNAPPLGPDARDAGRDRREIERRVIERRLAPMFFLTPS